MATGKVARRADANEVSALLDSPEVALLIDQLDGLRWTGRKGYGARALDAAVYTCSYCADLLNRAAEDQ